MRLNKFITVLILLITLLSIGTVSAVANEDTSDLNPNLNDIDVSDLSEDCVDTNLSENSDIVTSKGNILEVSDSSSKDTVNNLGESNDGTFSELNQKLANKSNTVIILDKNYTNTDNFDMNGIIINGSNLLIQGAEGKNITLNANYLSRIFNMTGSNITIKNINFINCNYSCHGISDHGGAIFINGDNYAILNCSFSNCTFRGDSQGTWGSAIFVNGINFTLDGCNFDKCDRSTYGTVYIYVKGNISISNCNFSNSYAGSSGSGLLLANEPEFHYNTVSINNCNFNNCSGSHGAITWEATINGKITINNCNFTDCSSEYDGGAIDWGSSRNSTISNCIFVNCSNNNDGGAIHFEGIENNTIVNCSFVNCSAKNNGGAIYAYDWKSNNLISDCNFTNCSSIKGGAIYGAIYAYNKNLTVTNSNFKNCFASDCGGAIYWDATEDTLSNCNFSYNKANKGSAIYINKLLNITNCAFDNNRAKSYDLTLVKVGDSINATLSVGDNLIDAIWDNSNNDTVVINGISYNKSDKKLNETINVTFNLYNDTTVMKSYKTGELFSVAKGALKVNAVHPESPLYTSINSNDLYLDSLIPTVVVTNASAKYKYPHFEANVTYDGVNVSNYGKIRYDMYYENGTKVTDVASLVVGPTYYVQGVFISNDYHIFNDSYSEKKAFTVDYTGTHTNISDAHNFTTNFTGKPGQNVTIGINVFDNVNGYRVEAYNVTFIFPDGSQTTLIIKNYQVNLTLPKNVTSGDVIVCYPGEENKFLPSNVTVNFTAEPLDVVINSSDFSGKPGQDVSVPINVVDENNDSVIVNNVSVVLHDGSNINAIVVDGNAKFTLPKNVTSGDVIIIYVGEEGKYNSSNVTVNFTAEPLNVDIKISDFSGKPNHDVSVFVNVTDENGDSVLVDNVIVVFADGTNINVSVVEGMGNFTLPKNITSGNVTIKYLGEIGKYEESNITVGFTAIPLNVTIDVPDFSGKPESKINVTVKVTDEDGNPVTEGNVTLVTHSGKQTVAVKNGSATFDFTLPSKPGSYSFALVYSGDETHASNSESFKVDVLKINTIITAQKGIVYNGNYYKVTLKDANGKALANKKVIITISGKKYTAKTDKKGVAKVKVSVANKYVGKSLKVSYKFAGDSSYNGASDSTKIKVIKMSTKILKASSTIVKNHKYFYVKLTTNTGKVLKNKIIIMHSMVSGKNYKFKTNSKGIIKTYLWVWYHPLSHYYKYIFKFAGNNYYKHCSKVFKVKIVK